MLRLTPPDQQLISRVLAAQYRESFTYPTVGATLWQPPKGYTVDRIREKLGNGPAIWNAAKAAVERWAMFPAPWTRIEPACPSIEPGAEVAIVAHTKPFWWLLPARITHVIDEPNRFGFAYGTLPGHIARGEEQFLIERDASGDVWFEVMSFSQVECWYARLAYPIVRQFQKRFKEEAIQALRAAVDCEHDDNHCSMGMPSTSTAKCN